MLVVEKADEEERKMFFPKVPFIVSRLYLSTNAFTWKINENVWRFHLMWKPHEPQSNCSILRGSGRSFFSGSWREKTTSFQADSSVRSSPFMDFFHPTLTTIWWLYNRKWRINIWSDQTEQTFCNQLKHSKHAVGSPCFSLENNSPANCFQSPIKATKWLSNLCRHTFVLLKVLQNTLKEINVIKTDSVIKNVNKIKKFEWAVKKILQLELNWMLVITVIKKCHKKKLLELFTFNLSTMKIWH